MSLVEINKSREAVGRRLSELSDSGLVNRIERGRYEIAELGQEYLAGDIDASKLQPSE